MYRKITQKREEKKQHKMKKLPKKTALKQNNKEQVRKTNSTPAKLQNKRWIQAGS